MKPNSSVHAIMSEHLVEHGQAKECHGGLERVREPQSSQVTPFQDRALGDDLLDTGPQKLIQKEPESKLRHAAVL